MVTHPSQDRPFDQTTPPEVLVAHARRKLRSWMHPFDDEGRGTIRNTRVMEIADTFEARVIRRTWDEDPLLVNAWLRLSVVVEFYPPGVLPKGWDHAPLQVGRSGVRIVTTPVGAPRPGYVAAASFDGSGGGSMHLV